MKNLHINIFTLAILSLSIFACQSSSDSDSNNTTEAEADSSTQSNSFLKESLTFYMSFDQGAKADFAQGDENLYTATSRKALDSAQAGLHNANHQFLEGVGKFGDAFQFGAKSDTVIFFKSKDNIAYDTASWSGTISFWLSLDPVEDLAPGYTDPIQITDVSYDDAAIWVDFTKENPRDFRLGVIGDKDIWLKDTLDMPYDDAFEKRLVRVKEPPFTNDQWTHITITYEALGTAESIATLYVDAEKIGEISGIDNPFTWELDKSNIFLGLSFIGKMDELSIFNQTFSAEEVKELHSLEGGVRSIL